MRKLLLNTMILASLALPLAVHADNNGLEWRLGGRSDIYYRHPGERDWRRAPGNAVDIGDGWVIGTDRRNGGYGIYRWSGYGWQRMPGAGVEIGGSFNNPWVVNDRGERFSWNGYAWIEQPGVGRRGNDVGYVFRPGIRNDDRRDNRRRDNDRWDNNRRDDDRRNNGRWDNDRRDDDRDRNRGRDDDRGNRGRDDNDWNRGRNR